jgi:choline dehydrogenase-like flavoprotein
MSIAAHRDYRAVEEHEADVVVVGTGAGGAACGAELAEAGFRVIFVEEGAYHPTSSFNPYVTESIPRMYRDASSTVILGVPPIPYVEGRCVGGSTVINGGMTWRAPEKILAGWAEEHAAPDLGPKGLEPLFEHVEKRVNAAPQSEESLGEDTRIMAAGAAKMGWKYLRNHRNQRACVGTNNCVTGCPTGAKQSTLVSYLPRAFAGGARCLTEVRVTGILVEKGRCVGVEGRAVNPETRHEDKRVRVRAKAVVLAAGAVHTANLLLGHPATRRHPQLGRNFYCHPNAKVLAVYPQKVDAWKGVSQGGQIREFHDEGIVFAENMVPPGALAAQLPFHGAEAWELMKDYDRMVLSGVLVEDSHAGRVVRSFLGIPQARYSITALDHARFKKGVKLLAEMHFAMGAKKVLLPFSDLHVANGPDDLARIEATQRSPKTMDLFTVHLMGTCRMGSERGRSVVDLDGQLWDLPGCFVADASLFPTAIAVNPQITIMALATRVAFRMADRGLEGARA